MPRPKESFATMVEQIDKLAAAKRRFAVPKNPGLTIAQEKADEQLRWALDLIEEPEPESDWRDEMQFIQPIEIVIERIAEAAFNEFVVSGEPSFKHYAKCDIIAFAYQVEYIDLIGRVMHLYHAKVKDFLLERGLV